MIWEGGLAGGLLRWNRPPAQAGTREEMENNKSPLNCTSHDHLDTPVPISVKQLIYIWTKSIRTGSRLGSFGATVTGSDSDARELPIFGWQGFQTRTCYFSNSSCSLCHGLSIRHRHYHSWQNSALIKCNKYLYGNYREKMLPPWRIILS